MSIPTVSIYADSQVFSINQYENLSNIAIISPLNPSLSSIITYSLAAGLDANLFVVDTSTGALAFKSAPDFEVPADAGADGTYDVLVNAANGGTTSQVLLHVTIKDINEAPIISSNGSGPTAAISLGENAATVTTVRAADPDAGSTLTYSILGGADAALFQIDALTGALSFTSAPNYEISGDAGGDNVYDVIVQASDGALTDTQAIAVTVTNLNEAPSITSNGSGSTAAISMAENATAVTTVTATDPDAGAGLSFGISGGADADLFSIDATTGALLFKSAPNYEVPVDVGANNVYDVIVKVSDGVLIVTQVIAVTVTNIVEHLAITSNNGTAAASVSIQENEIAVTAFTATSDTAVTYSITGGADASLFQIDAAAGQLSFKAVPDFETPLDAGSDNVYDVTVAASDGTSSAAQDLAVTIINVNEAPKITSSGGGAAAAINIAENGTIVTTVSATDEDAGTTVAFSIAGGADAAKFAINSATGALTFNSAPNFEAPADVGADNVYDVVVQSSDGSLTTQQALAVTVTNTYEAPFIATNGGGAAGSVSIAENGSLVTTVQATSDTPATYSIAGGADASLFQIDAVTGQLSFKAAPDFETPLDAGHDNVYDVIVSATDGANAAIQALAVTVTNLKDATPTISSEPANPITIAENSALVATFHVSSSNLPDLGTPTYQLTGPDAALFQIDAATGVLSFKASPDFEAPLDVGKDNTYSVTVAAKNQAGNLTDSQTLSINVFNLNEAAPTITSNDGGDTGVIMFAEGSAAVTTVTASDTDAGTSLSYSLSGGADATLFNIDAVTGVLTFKVAPSIEAPADVGANNVYEVIVQASDGTMTDTQALAVTVERRVTGTSRDDKSLVGTDFADHILGFGGKDLLSGLAGDDILDGGAGGDTMSGGLGDDTFIVDSKRDLVIEWMGQGTDSVFTSLSRLVLNENVENLTFIGTGPKSGVGNELANVLTGASGSDKLFGEGGDDTLFGLGGQDLLVGGSGSDRLDGGSDIDKMYGGIGNDTYVVDNVLDLTIEKTGEGIDAVEASVTWKLQARVENLILTGSTAINGTGNGSDNLLIGNAAANALNGGAGDDVLSGGLGNDTLFGGRGADKFLFDSFAGGGNNVDLVRDFSSAAGDQVQLSRAVFTGLSVPGALAQGVFVASATATAGLDADDRIIYNTATGQLWYDVDGLGGEASVQIGSFGATTHPALAYTDFVIVA